MKTFKSFSKSIEHELGEKGEEKDHKSLKQHPSIEKIADKHNVSKEFIISQIKKGYKLEKEHTKNIDMAIDIAIQHINEFPLYYDELIKMEKKINSKYKNKSVKEDHIPIAMGKMLDSEGAMIKNQLETIERSVKLLRAQIKSDDMQIPAWVQAKVTLATEGILTCANYMAGKDQELGESMNIDEIAPVVAGGLSVARMAASQIAKNAIKGATEKTVGAAASGIINTAGTQTANTSAQQAAKLAMRPGSSSYVSNLPIDRSAATAPTIPKPQTPSSSKPQTPLPTNSSGSTSNQISPNGVKNKTNDSKIRKNISKSIETSISNTASIAKKGVGGYVGMFTPKEEFSQKLLSFKQINDIMETAAWQRKEGKNPEGGLNQKGIDSYRKENPGSKLSMAVTTPPSKLSPNSKAAKRRKSFCARMSGMPGPMKDEKGRPTRKALSLRKWNC
jgi:hypothetical protein